MPQKKQPVLLQDLALKAIGLWVKSLGQSLIQAESVIRSYALPNMLMWINETLYANVPWYLYDEMAVQVLSSVIDLIQDTKASYDQFVPMTVFLNHMKIAVSLTEVVVHSHLRQINISRWPKIMRLVLYQNLYKLIGLEHLNLGSGSGGWDTSETEKYILSGVQNMSNLTSLCLCFDCTNNIIITVGTNCPLLQNLDVTSSRSVTDKSIPALLNCKHLKDVKLYRTSVSVEGYKELLSELPGIQDIGRCDEFGKVLDRFNEEHLGELGLKALQCRDMCIEHFQLLIVHCPNLVHISVFHDEHIADLKILSSLVNLRELKILNCDFYTDNVKDLLEIRGVNLTWLHLEHVEEIDLNALIYISQFCPKLKSLILYNCEFLQHNTSVPISRLKVKPFICLERLLCVADCALNHLEFLLSHCINIRFIQLGSSTGICKQTMCKILMVNPMKHLEELKILYSYDFSMQTVKLLMGHCEQLRILSELECWGGITGEELIEFKDFIRRNNLNLDIRSRFIY